ncbi:hypothetical protein NLG97_g6927 [Lecanicillium saksenae]|uniref:Uncharacterized protein n=1 Tax=Lecanicillium saksenae TaxID=468837 RepID=A0ACC1QNT9_9HYPO|nr:hypothetical protein NLG97_g6927 [Lecanicillium saksenae]
MAKRGYSLAMADGRPSHPTSSRFAGNGADWQYPVIFSSSHDLLGLSQPKRICPCGKCQQPIESQSKYTCTHGLRPEAPLSISSSESDWSTSPQRLSVRDASKDEPMGMTLKLGDSLDSQNQSGYRCATQDEALLGCGSWLNERQMSGMASSVPFDEAMVHEASSLAINGQCHPKLSNEKP